LENGSDYLKKQVTTRGNNCRKIENLKYLDTIVAKCMFNIKSWIFLYLLWSHSWWYVK